MSCLPPAVKIGPHLYLVQEVPENDLSSTSMSARVDPDAQLISITGSTTESAKCEHLIHETLHALLNGFDLDEDKEELVCTILGSGLLSFIRDNWGFIQYCKLTCLPGQVQEAIEMPEPESPDPDPA